MNQLNGKYVNVVLSVEDGRGMDFVKHPIHVSANFSNRILESDRILPEDRTTFNTELIWESEKKELRKIRSSNQPLRVECICTDPQNRRDRIGFVLLSLRSAQIIPLKEAKCCVNFKWYKLIGCQADKKKHHPEIYLALSIRDHLLNELEEDLPKTVPLILEEAPNETNEEKEFTSSYPLKYLDDGFIQIGDEEDQETFSLNLLVKEARNLDTLLPEALVFRQNQEKYHMTFKIFGVTIKTKSYYKHVHDYIALNEKVVVRILSTEQTMFDFFGTEGIGISLFNGHELLGNTYVYLGQVTFEEQTAKCFFKAPDPNDAVPFGGNDSSPFIEIQTWIKKSTDHRFKAKAEEKQPTKVVISNLERVNVSCPFGDQLTSCILDKLEKVDVKSKSESSLINVCTDNVAMTKSVDTVIKNTPLSPRQTKLYNVLSTYVKYVLEVSLQNFVWRIAQRDKIVIFRFLHPRASNCITIFTQIPNQVGETTDLKNIGVKVTYISTKDQIENILNAWPPKLVLTDEREKLLSEECEFDASKFFTEKNKNHRVKFGGEKMMVWDGISLEARTYLVTLWGENLNADRYTADFKAIRTLQPLAKVQVTLKIEVGDITELNEDTAFHLKPPVIDELLSVKELANIEQWKTTQEGIFKKELERLKEEESERLENVWKEKEKVMEEKLESQLQKCKIVEEKMQDNLNCIKTHKYLVKIRNEANIFREILKENMEMYSEADSKVIIDVLSKTQRDNEYLKKLVRDQREKLRLLEKTTLTKEETTRLLGELKELEKGFNQMEDAKQYFQDQWRNGNNKIDEFETDLVTECSKVDLTKHRCPEELSNLSIESFSKYLASKFDLDRKNMASRSNEKVQENDS